MKHEMMPQFFPSLGNLALLLFQTLGIASYAAEVVRNDDGKWHIPVARGSFVQSWLCRAWDDARWRAEFLAMQEVGMDTLIVEADIVEACFRNAQEAGFKVFVGLNFHNDWWTKTVSDPDWLFGQMQAGNTVADELFARYKERYPQAFHGWYWCWEVWNGPGFLTPTGRETLAKALDVNVRHLHQLDRSMPVMFCPFMNHKMSSPQAYAEFWRYVFANCDLGRGDIFAPQDCIGAGGLTLDCYTDWFAQLRKAVETRPGLRFWADIETFDQKDWTSAPLNRFLRQLTDLRPFVEDYVTFAYSHYYSPHQKAAGFQTTLRDYVQTGRLETQRPTIPPDARAERQSNGTVRLTWEAAADNVGVCGYRVFRNGSCIKHIQLPRPDEISAREFTTFLDEKPPGHVDLVFEIRAYDFAGNSSEKPSRCPVLPAQGPEMKYQSNNQQPWEIP